MWRSVPQMPAARTARRTCPGPGRGWGRSRSVTFPSPRAVFTTACMVVMLAPPYSTRIQWRILPHLEGDGVIFQEAQQGITLLGEHSDRVLRQRIERCHGKHRRLFLALHAPGPRDPSIDEECCRNAAILRPQNEMSMLVRKHPGAVGV